MDEEEAKEFDSILYIVNNKDLLQTEILHAAFQYIKYKPTASIQEAISHGLSEWDK